MSAKPYAIKRESDFTNQLAGLPRGYQAKVEGIIEDELKANPYRAGTLLKGDYGNKGIRKIRIGKFRLMYVIRENPTKVVGLLSIDDRSDAY